VELSEKLLRLIKTADEKLLTISQSESEVKPSPDKWSSIELLGHLIDSAINNTRRFVLAQIQENLIFSGYKHEEWVKNQAYQNRNWNDILITWKVLNIHIIKLMSEIPEELLIKQTTKHNFYEIAWREVEEGEKSSLEYFINDYIGHMIHHLNQIFRINNIDEITVE